MDRKPRTQDDTVERTSGLGVLGTVTFERNGERLSLGGPKAQQIVAVLVASRGRAVSTDLLMDTLWGDLPPASAAGTLHSHISRLRAVLEPDVTLVREGDGYRLDAPGCVIDAERFQVLVDTAAELDLVDTVAGLDEAIQLWRGPAFGPHADLDPVRPEAVRLEELRLVATERWAAARLELGDLDGLVGDLESMIDRHPLRERFWVLLMLVLHRTGRTAEALRRGNELRRLLREEVGLDVSAAVRDIEAKILEEDSDPRPVIAPPRAAKGAHLLGSTSFVGREPEITVVVSALQQHAVVTVTGPGGVGKTRLALRSAAGLIDAEGVDVTVVELATLRDPSGIASLIARELDIQQRPNRTLTQTIVDHLAPRGDLLVLDNCEHLIDAIGPLVDRLRTACPELRLLTTSRQPLGLAGEFVFVVAPLALPPARTLAEVRESPAVELFVSRAQLAVPDFELTGENAHAVADICQRLDGLPLGLELAAARLRAMGVEALAERLAQRVQSLGQLQRSADGRQHTLVDLVRWSYDLLDGESQHVFAQLAVFAGGFDLDTVEAVCRMSDASRDTIDVLADLVQKSMVVLVDRHAPRYRLLEPLREFALDRLIETGRLSEVERRHVDWFVGLAERGAIGIDSPDEARWSARLDREFDNLRAAFQCAARLVDVDSALRLVAALRELSFRRVNYEVTAWADVAAGLPKANVHPLHPTMVAMSAYGRWVVGDMQTAIRCAHAALDEEPNGESATGLAERVLGNALFYVGEPDEALRWMDRMLSSARAARDPARLAHAMYMQSVAHTSLGDTVRGALLAGEARGVASAAGSGTALAQAGYALGLALEGTDQSEALAHLEESARLAGAAGSRWVEAFALTEVHWLRARRGEHIAALAGFGDVVRTWYRGGDWANQWLSLRRVFAALVDVGDLEAGAVLYGALSAAGTAHALPFEPADAEQLDHIVDDLRSLLGPAAFDEAVRRGESMTDSSIVEYVIKRIDELTKDFGRGA